MSTCGSTTVQIIYLRHFACYHIHTHTPATRNQSEISQQLNGIKAELEGIAHERFYVYVNGNIARHERHNGKKNAGCNKSSANKMHISSSSAGELFRVKLKTLQVFDSIISCESLKATDIINDNRTCANVQMKLYIVQFSHIFTRTRPRTTTKSCQTSFSRAASFCILSTYFCSAVSYHQRLGLQRIRI